MDIVMSVRRKKICLVSLGTVCIFLMAGLCFLREYLGRRDGDTNQSCYSVLPPDTSREDPLLYLNDDFTLQEGFHTNLPIVILSMDGELTDYKGFSENEE